MTKLSVVQNILNNYKEAIVSERVPGKRVLLHEGEVSDTIYLVKEGR